MNAAARLVHRGVLSRQLVRAYFLTRQQILALFLGSFLLFSALSMVYTSYSTRMLYASYHTLLQERDLLQVQKNQLLLEETTLQMPDRTQRLAENQLNMQPPDPKFIFTTD